MFAIRLFAILLSALLVLASPTSARLQTGRIHTTRIIGRLYKNRGARGSRPRRRLVSVSGRGRIIGGRIGTASTLIIAAELGDRHKRIRARRSGIGGTGNCGV